MLLHDFIIVEYLIFYIKKYFTVLICKNSIMLYLDLMFSVTVKCLLTSDFLFQKALHDVLSFRKETDGITVDIAFQW